MTANHYNNNNKRMKMGKKRMKMGSKFQFLFIIISLIDFNKHLHQHVLQALKYARFLSSRSMHYFPEKRNCGQKIQFRSWGLVWAKTHSPSRFHGNVQSCRQTNQATNGHGLNITLSTLALFPCWTWTLVQWLKVCLTHLSTETSNHHDNHNQPAWMPRV